jgi:hypothetical protein
MRARRLTVGLGAWLSMPRPIEDFFEEFVCQPFHGHAETSGWKEEVLPRADDWSHRTNNILERGLADFDAPYKNLTPAEKVTIYCYQYMQKHAASTCYVFDTGAKLGLAEPGDWIVLDFGSGPATLPVALAWLKAQDGQSIGASAKPLLNYIGIERSKEMREKAKSVARESGLFHKDSDFGFGKSFDDANEITPPHRQLRSMLLRWS